MPQQPRGGRLLPDPLPFLKAKPLPSKTKFKLKQLLTSTRLLEGLPEDGVTRWESVKALPPRRPPQKFSDVSLRPAKYRDPRSRLQYADKAEARAIRSMSADDIAQRLLFRGVQYKFK